MDIKEEKQDDVVIVTIDKHLDTSTAGDFETRLLGIIDRGERAILIDCEHLLYVNSAGLKVFLLAAKRLEPLGGRLVLCSMGSAVLMIFEMIGFNRIMKIVASREEGLQALRNQSAPA